MIQKDLFTGIIESRIIRSGVIFVNRSFSSGGDYRLIFLSRSFFLAIILLFSISLQAHAHKVVKSAAIIENSVIKVSHAWVRAMPPGSVMTAAYLRLQNTSDRPVKVISVNSPQANDCSIHKTVIEKGFNRMREVKYLSIPAHQSVSLSPGGLHIMIMGMNKPLKKGTLFPIVLKYDNGSLQHVNALIK